MKTSAYTALGALILGISSPVALADTDCLKLSVEIKHAAAAKPDSVLELVERRVSANPSCACEIVKAAIGAVEADVETVAAIVEVAAQAAPDQMRLISQCAVAVAPDALTEVQMVMARLEPGQGGDAYVGESSKSPKAPVDVKPAWNPLDFPGQGIGPNPGSNGGLSWLPLGGATLPNSGAGSGPLVIIPGIVDPLPGTQTNFTTP